MSVATMTSYLPDLKPSSASTRSRCVRLECSTATACLRRLQLARDAVGAVFGAGKNQRAVVIRALEQRHEQIEFLLGRDRIDRVRDGFGRRTPRADFDHLRIAQNPRGEPLDLGRKRGGEKQRLPVGGNLFDDPAHVGQETHVEHAIDFVEDEDVDVAQVHRPCSRRSSSRPGVAQTMSHAAGSFFASACRSRRRHARPTTRRSVKRP